MTRLERYAAILETITLSDPETRMENPERFLLVSHYEGAENKEAWLDHLDELPVSLRSDVEENYFFPTRLFDLDTGDEFCPELEVTFTPIPAERRSFPEAIRE